MPEEKFDSWAILELFGHRKLAGKVSESTLAGGAFLRIDIPGGDGKDTTQFYSPGSVYSITPTSEKLARLAAAAYQPAPISPWELTAFLPRSNKKATCRVCGCTEDNACIINGEPCYWVESDLCSACAAIERRPGRAN